MPVQYRSLTEAATVSTPAMVPPLLLSDRGSHANAVGVNARANTKPGLPPSTMSVSLLRLVHSSSGAPTRRVGRSKDQDSRLTLVSVRWSSWNQ